MSIETQIEKSRQCASWLEEAIGKFIKNNQNINDSRSLNDFPLNHDQYAVVIHEYDHVNYGKTNKTNEMFYIQIGGFNYVFNNITQIPGLTSYPKKSRFFISVAPHIGYQHFIDQEAQSILAVNPNLSEKMFFKERSKIEIRYAKRYLNDSIKAIAKLQKLKLEDEIHIIVIGNENLMAYQDTMQLEKKLLNNNSSSLSIESYVYPLNKVSELASDKFTEQNIVLHALKGKSNILELQSADFDYLYSILVSQKPILIHCSQGLDRAGKLLFGLLLGEKFKNIFLSAKNSQAMYENIEKQWINFKEEHSPQVLGNIIDFKQAVYIGFILGLIHLQNKLRQSIERTNFFRSNNKCSPSLINDINKVRGEVEAKLLALLVSQEKQIQPINTPP